MSDADVIVVGAGVIGVAAARALAPDHDVIVLDKGQVAGDTTAKASGLITVVPDYDEQPAIARHAMDFFEDYDGTGEFDYTERESVQLVTADQESWARDQAARVADNGFDVEYLEAEAAEAAFPGEFVLDGYVGVVRWGDTGWVDPYTYTMTLRADAEADGAEFRTDTPVESVDAEGGEVTGVTTAEGRLEAPEVVCAAGWRTRGLLREHLEVPLRPFRWQTINLEVDRDITGSPIGWEGQTGLYWRPEHNGDLHVGGGTYWVDEPGGVRDSASEWFRELVATRIDEFVANLGDARLASEDCCPTGDAATPDDLPIVDAPAEGPDGLTIAVTGPIGGIMSSPYMATAVRSWVTDEPAPFPLEPHRLDRFEDRSADFECRYVYRDSGGELYQ